jgi:hypothetical protein
MENKKIFRKDGKGAATFVFTLVLITLTSLIIIFAANYATLGSKASTNLNRNAQALEAAIAGMEFGINYLNQNNSVILASPSGGYLQPFSNGSTTNVTLANNSKYSITYTNPTANDYTVIKITSVGTSDDNSATRTVSQLVKFGSMLVNAPLTPLIAKDEIDLKGNSQIINTYNPNTIVSGGSTSISGSASTILNSGTSSTSGNIRSDIQQNSLLLASMTNNDFFATSFGVAPASVKSSAANYFQNSTNTNYRASLASLSGTSIWIEQTGGTASLTGNVTIGSPTNPVLLIINGDVNFSGNVTIYGFVFIYGSSETDLTGNVTIVGGIATTGELDATGSIQVVYSPSVLSNLQNNSSMRYYAKIPGSWRDF